MNNRGLCLALLLASGFGTGCESEQVTDEPLGEGILIAPATSGASSTAGMMAPSTANAAVGTTSPAGGATAAALADVLAHLAAENQVLVVTHLPQVVARAESHYRVEKVVEVTTAATLPAAVQEEGP